MILVTGATGMIGSALVARLVRQGKPVRLAVRNSTLARTALSKTTDLTGVDLQECDFLSSERDLTSLVSGCDIVVHLAGLVHQPDKPAEMFEELNLRTTGRLAHTAKSCGVDTFLFTSTMAVYGPPPFENISEEAKPNPDTDYGRTKLAAEKSLAEIRPARSVIVLRPSLVYGPGDRGNMLPLIRQILKRRYFHIGEASARKSVIYAADLAQVIESALEKAPRAPRLQCVKSHSPKRSRNRRPDTRSCGARRQNSYVSRNFGARRVVCQSGIGQQIPVTAVSIG